MAKLMVLGAGIYQVPLLETIRAMGHESLVCSIPGPYPGFAAADKAAFVNTVDQEAILALAREEKIDGILTTGTDVAVRTIGYVCDALGLAGPSYRAACNVTDKYRMREAMKQGGVRCPAFARVYTPQEARAAAEEIGLPVIFKCVDKSGSRGISRVDELSQVEKAFAYSFAETREQYILVEKFLPGPEIGLDGYLGPEGELLLPHQKLVHHNGLTGVPLGHCLPFEETGPVLEDILEQTRLCAKAVGLEGSFVNLDIILRPEGAYILEIGARGGATCIPELITAHTGVDYYRQMVNRALGLPVELSAAKAGKPCVARLLGAPRGGVLARLEAPAPLPEGILELKLDYKAGEAVREFRLGPDRIGHLLAWGDTPDQALERAVEGCRRVQLAFADAPEKAEAPI